MEKTFLHIEEHVAAFVDDLVRVAQKPSISSTGEGIQEMAELLAGQLSSLGGETKILPTPGNPVVYSKFQGKSNKTLMFYNHYDVQPIGALDEWDSDPFAAEIRNDTIYCRGVADNKGNIMCRIKSVESILAAEGELPLNVVFVIEGEEEIGSPNLESFVASHADLLRADGVIWEGGFKDFDDRPELYLGVKGMIAVELTAKASNQELHSMFANVAPNALWNLVRTLNTLQDEHGRILVKGFNDQVLPPTQQELSMLEEIPYDWEQFRKKIGVSDLAYSTDSSSTLLRHLYQPTCNLIGLHGGYTGERFKTMIPNVAMVKIDFRLVPNQDPEDVFQKVKEHIEGLGFGEIEVRKLGSTFPYKASVNSSVAQAAISSAKEVYEQPPVVYPLVAGTSPMHKLAHQLQIPVIMAGCTNANSNMHGPNENLRIRKDYVPGIKHMAALMFRFAELTSEIPA